MKASFLLRFDDICPSMNWDIWDQIEKILLENDITPILAVVPDNQDEVLNHSQPIDHFWDHVRRWQKLGWTIGMHGYQHIYSTKESGIIGLNDFSEFAGLPAEEQDEKIQKSMEIFKREQVTPTVWIAPGNSFDETTVNSIKKVGIRTISDGHFLSPRLDAKGMLWVPHQIWRFYNMPFGTWTIGFHHNSWTAVDLENFRKNIQNFKSSITTLDKVIGSFNNRRHNWFDSCLSRFYLVAIKLKLAIRDGLGALRT
jgi:predicted deacetylase